MAPLAVEELVFRLLRSDAAAAVYGAIRAGDARPITEAMRLMRMQAFRRLSVEAIARQVAMSPSHFAHRFRAIARMSPMRFVKEVRLDAARTLLLSEGARASDVALRVGTRARRISPAISNADLAPRPHVTLGDFAEEVATPTLSRCGVRRRHKKLFSVSHYDLAQQCALR